MPIMNARRLPQKLLEKSRENCNLLHTLFLRPSSFCTIRLSCKLWVRHGCWILSRGLTGAFSCLHWMLISREDSVSYVYCFSLSMDYPDWIALNSRDIDHLFHREVCRKCSVLSLLNSMWWSRQGPVASCSSMFSAVWAWILWSGRWLWTPRWLRTPRPVMFASEV